MTKCSDTALQFVENFQPDSFGNVNTTAMGDLPEGTRQILVVNSYSITSYGNFLTKPSKTVTSESSIRFLGTASPNSDSALHQGYIFFSHNGIIAPPVFIKSQGRIDLTLDAKIMPLVLEQLKHKNKFLWIGAFADGNIYADLHSI